MNQPLDALPLRRSAFQLPWRLWSLALLIGLMSMPAPTHAQAPPAGSLAATVIEQHDLTGNGRPDLTILETGSTTNRDRVRVYDGGGNMASSSDWRIATDLRNDTWVFDTAGDGSAQLVLRFTTDGRRTQATLYTDNDGDGQVSLEVHGASVNVTEVGHPPLTAEVIGDWWLPDGRLNWNVRFQTDGPVPHIHTYNLTDFWNRSYITRNGIPDVELQFADHDHDGIPEYAIWRLLTPTPGSEGAMRTWIWANEGRHAPTQPDGYAFWPYLADRLPFEGLADGVAKPAQQRYFDTPPFASVSFNAGTLRLLAFEGYPIEQGFHVHTLNAFDPQQLNYANFENIQAYYDLADDSDGSPELHIRHRYFEPEDPLSGSIPATTNEIRWSWEQRDGPGLAWDYKLGLAGRHPMTSIVTVGDFRFQTVPYTEWPNWVLAQPWDYATFLANEGDPFLSTEGIYDWAPVEALVGDNPDNLALTRYLAGDATIQPEQAFTAVQPGWRGEFAPELGAQTLLYFSPLDRRLHLRHAAYGIWQIDAEQTLRMVDNDQDGYFDEWAYVGPMGPTQALHHAPGYLIYSDAEQVVLKAIELSPTLFETLPPVTAAERQELNLLLDAHEAALNPHELLPLLEQFPGAVVGMQGVTLRDYRRLAADGFRFVLEVRAGAQVRGDNAQMPFAGLAPGAYAVVYANGFQITPLTPPAPQVTLHLHEPRQLAANRLQVQLGNTGLEDLSDATLELWATPPEGATTLLLSRTVTLPAQEPLTLTLGWQPRLAGEWQIEPRLVETSGATTTFAAVATTVIPAIAASPGALLAVSSTTFLLPLIGLGLILATLIGVVVIRQQHKPTA